jgi:hypothetical protein
MKVEFKNTIFPIIINKLEIIKDNKLKYIVWKRGNSILKYIKDQTSEKCLSIVGESGECDLELKYVRVQTDEICLVGVKNYGCQLKFVKNQTDEILPGCGKN